MPDKGFIYQIGVTPYLRDFPRLICRRGTSRMKSGTGKHQRVETSVILMIMCHTQCREDLTHSEFWGAVKLCLYWLLGQWPPLSSFICVSALSHISNVCCLHSPVFSKEWLHSLWAGESLSLPPAGTASSLQRITVFFFNLAFLFFNFTYKPQFPKSPPPLWV